MKNIIHRLVIAAAALAAGFFATKEKLAAAEQQLTTERQVNADLHTQILANAGENALLKQATETAQSDLKKLQDQYAEETAEASAAIDNAEKAAAEVHADEEIPITIEDGTVTHDTEAELPKLASEVPADDPNAKQPGETDEV